MTIIIIMVLAMAYTFYLWGKMVEAIIDYDNDFVVSLVFLTLLTVLLVIEGYALWWIIQQEEIQDALKAYM